MTEATQRPWYATGIHVQSAAINEDNYVCTAEGETPEAAIANADLIVKAVNSHDALVAALEVISGAIHSDEWDEMGALLEAIDKSVIAALEQVK
mgnify:CR=1 FL=1|jgi:hypothetical protein